MAAQLEQRMAQLLVSSTEPACHKLMTVGKDRMVWSAEVNDPLVQHLLTDGRGQLFCIAGGYVLIHEVTGLVGTDGSDLDLWINGVSCEERKQKTKTVLASLLKYDPAMCVHALGSSVLSCHMSNYPRTVQIICKKGSTPWDIISDFDIDVCKAFYALDVQTQKLYGGAFQSTLEGWRTKTVVVPVDKANEVSVYRLEKLRRRGFSIHCAGFEPPAQEYMEFGRARHAPCTALRKRANGHSYCAQSLSWPRDDGLTGRFYGSAINELPPDNRSRSSALSEFGSG